MTYASLSPRRGASVYARVGMETTVHSASPHRLIVMLFDGAANAIALARQHMVEQRIAQKGQFISKAIDIVVNGLQSSLDPVAGGAEGARLVSDLSALYDYVVRRLLYANLRNDPAALDEAARLLEDIASAWREIEPAQHQPAAATA